MLCSQQKWSGGTSFKALHILKTRYNFIERSVMKVCSWSLIIGMLIWTCNTKRKTIKASEAHAEIWVYSVSYVIRLDNSEHSMEIKRNRPSLFCLTCLHILRSSLSMLQFYIMIPDPQCKITNELYSSKEYLL